MSCFASGLGFCLCRHRSSWPQCWRSTVGTGRSITRVRHRRKVLQSENLIFFSFILSFILWWSLYHSKSIFCSGKVITICCFKLHLSSSTQGSSNPAQAEMGRSGLVCTGNRAAVTTSVQLKAFTLQAWTRFPECKGPRRRCRNKLPLGFMSQVGGGAHSSWWNIWTQSGRETQAMNPW